MKTKSMHKGLAVVLAIVMMLALIPVTSLSMKASAASGSYVLDTSADLQAAAAGAFTDGQTAKAGTENYFTLYYSAKTKIDKSEKPFDDGYTGAQRVNFGGKADAAGMKNFISFTTGAAASVKVWWAQGGDDNRQVVIYDKSGAEVTATSGTWTKNSAYISTLEVPAAGTYFLGGKENNNYFFKVEVTEKVAAASAEFTLDTSADLQAAAAGAFTDGQTAKAGTDGFFTMYYSAKTKIDKSEKPFDDGYTGAQRVNFGGKADPAGMKNFISFTTTDAASVKVWWAQGGDDNRQVVIYDKSGTEITATSGTWTKNSAYISTLEVPAAGTYFLGGKENNNYFFKVVVTTGGGSAPVARGDWSKVAAPVITSAAQEKNAEGKLTDNIVVSVNAVVGNDGGDAVKVIMTDKNGKEVAAKQSLAEKSAHDIVLPATESGTYTVKATLVREGEADKASAAATASFTLTLKAPTISSATNKGNGNVLVKWDKVNEADGYVVYAAGKEVKTSTNSATVEGLKVGDKVEFTVAAVRGSETGEKSAGLTTTITAKEQQEWGFTAYGTSTSKTKNTYSGNINEGSVTVSAQGNAGKLNRTADNGYSFYYTAVPADKNFTFRAKVHIDKWSYDNGQEGFGIAAVDSLPETIADTSHWTNFFMSLVTRYDYDGYKSRLGVGVHSNTGITPENWTAVKDSSYDRTLLYGGVEPLDTTGKDKNFSGTQYYNIVGNCDTPDKLEKAGVTTIAELTDFDLEITKNNTGFYCSYYKDGKLVKTVKHWGTDELTKLDKDNIYVGIVAARNCTVTVKQSDLKLELRDPKSDPAPEAKPKKNITPSITIESGEYANSTSHNLILKTSYKGTATVTVNGAVAAQNVVVGDKVDSDGNVMETIVPITIKSGKNSVAVTYKVDASVNPGEDYVFTTRDAKASATVTYDNYLASQGNLYVAPNGSKYGNGTKENPLDIQTALNIAAPGQKVILMEGTYKTKTKITAPRGVSGTKDKMIYMIADPDAKTRPVLDCEGNTGIGLDIVGDYWYIKGFDVCHAGSNGVRIAGNYCVADQIDARENYSTGFAIQGDSKYSRLLWPSYNLVKNSNAYYNCDAGGNNADGFSAKLIVGKGNVFDNCVSHHNSDDGWDLYGRNVTIEPVTIQNCVSYKNGYLKDDKKSDGAGNGFKLGGDNNAAAHVLIDSFAFNNKGNGITCNSSPNIIVKNSTAYNNESGGIALYTKASNTDFESSGVISYKNGAADTFEPKGTQDVKKVDMTHWNGANGVADDWFKSLTFKGSVARNADGSINMEGFLELTDKASKNAGATMTTVPSENVTVTQDTDVPNPRTGFSPFAIIAIVLAGAGVGVCVFKRKRRA